MRIAQDCLLNCVAAFLFPVHYLETERRTRNAIDLADKIPPLVVKKTFAVRDQELQVADLGRVDRWVIDFSDASVVERVPHVTRSGICSSNRNLGASRPSRLNAGTA